MTVYESVRNWLNQIVIDCGHTDGVFIELESIPNEQGYRNAGLFNSPNDIHTPLMAGGMKHEEFLSFYYKNNFGQNDDRIKNEEFFDKFRNAIYNKNLDSDFPADGRRWQSIEINGGIYPAQRTEDNQSADYLVPLKLTFYT